MKTIQQQLKYNLAKKYFAKSDNPKRDIDRKTDYEIGFYDGIAHAQNWIQFKKELPTFKGEKYMILVGGGKSVVLSAEVFVIHSESIIETLSQMYEFWRPIELK